MLAYGFVPRVAHEKNRFQVNRTELWNVMKDETENVEGESMVARLNIADLRRHFYVIRNTRRHELHVADGESVRLRICVIIL